MHLRSRAATAVALTCVLVALTTPAANAAGLTRGEGARPVAAAAPAEPASVPTATDEVDVTNVPVVVPTETAPQGTDPTPTQVPTTPDEQTPLVADIDVANGRAATPALQTDGVQTVGVTWPDSTDGAAIGAQVRTKKDDTWSAWVSLDPGEAPDPSTADAEHATRGGTEALWVGDVDAVQVSFETSASGATDDLSLSLVGTATTTPSSQPRASASPAPTPSVATPVPTPRFSGASWSTGRRTSSAVLTSSASRPVASSTVLPTVAPNEPRVISRSEWGAPAPVCASSVASGLVGAVVHHTAGSNSYSTVAEAMQQIRNDAAYHIQGRGWCDIGYNFVVDKWGNIYEGRAGSLSQPVIGVHAGGFNTGTVGVAMLGTYDTAPSAATLDAVGQIIGWRLGAYRVDPRGTMDYATGNGENSRYHNQTVTLPRVFGHRDVAYTACPGDGGYAALPTIRSIAWDTSVRAWSSPPSSLLRTAEDSTVYLVAGTRRFAIDDLATLGALAPLGPVSYVSSQYLAGWSAGPHVRRVVLQPDGTVSFFDAGIRLAFGTCAQVTEFGLDCADAVPITAAQTAALHDGGRMASLYHTTSGKTFYITGGTKREVADDASFAAAGLTSSAVWLLESGIAYLPYGDPIVRPGLMLQDRGGTRSYLVTSSGAITIPNPLRSVPGLPTTRSTPLDAASTARLTSAGALAPVVKDAGGTAFFLSASGKHPVLDSASIAADTPVAPADLLAQVPLAASISAPFLLKGEDDGTVYLVRAGRLLAVRSWPDLVLLAGGNASPTIERAAGPLVRLVPSGGLYSPPGMLAKTASDGTVYLLDGSSNRVAVSTFAVTAELGANRLAVVPDAELGARSTSAGNLRTLLTCGARTYIGLGGSLWEIPAADRAAFPSSASAVSTETCAALPHAAATAPRFWLASDGTIFFIDGGLKHPIGSYGRYLQLGGTPTTTLAVSAFALSQVPAGGRA